MEQTVRLIDPQQLQRNRENPRLIFREDELQALQDSIAQQGILVPLTVFQDGKKFYLLDGERRWRCALKLGHLRVPVIIQPKPDRLQNLMIMFAIHNSRKDWDPLPTALKLEQLEIEFQKRNGRLPKEAELAGIASIGKGEVRRLRKLLRLPEKEKRELLLELRKPRSKQKLSVDQVLESTKGAEALRKRGVINRTEERSLRRALIRKFRAGVIKNTVSPRKLVRMARAVERKEISRAAARKAVKRLVEKSDYSVDHAFEHTVEKVDFEHSVQQVIDRLIRDLKRHKEKSFLPSKSLAHSLQQLQVAVRDFLKK